MANWIMQNKVDTPKNLENFNVDGWKYKETSKKDSLGNKRMVFVKVI